MKKSTKINAIKKPSRIHFLFPIFLTFINFLLFSVGLGFLFYKSGLPRFFIASEVAGIVNFICFLECNYERDKVKEKENEMSKEIMELLSVPFDVLMKTLEAKDSYTEMHSGNVAKYSLMIAEKMNLSAEERILLNLGGKVHDIGKVGLPDAILNKPEDLTKDEFEIVKKHPIDGYNIIKRIKELPEVKYITKYHHENFDGTGYPEGKKGETIPLLARIVRVADSYDAITSGRSYKKGIPTQEEIIKDFESKKGTHYDPKVVDAMVAIIREDKKYRLRSS